MLAGPDYVESGRRPVALQRSIQTGPRCRAAVDIFLNLALVFDNRKWSGRRPWRAMHAACVCDPCPPPKRPLQPPRPPPARPCWWTWSALSADQELFESAREAVGERNPVWRARSADEAADLLITGRCGVLAHRHGGGVDPW